MLSITFWRWGNWGTERCKIVHGHTASKNGAVEERIPRCKPRSVGLQSPGFGRGTWLSQQALSVWCWVDNPNKTASWWRKLILKITDPFIALNLTLTAAEKVHIEEFLSLFFGAEKKKSNECYFILAHLRVSWVRKAGSISCCQRQVPETSLQCSNSDTMWPSQVSPAPPWIPSHTQTLRRGGLLRRTESLRKNQPLGWDSCWWSSFCFHQKTNPVVNNQIQS